jgi:integrase
MIKIGMRLFKYSNGIWYVEIERNKKVSLRTRDKKEAQYLFKQIQRQALAGKLFLFDQNTKKELKDFTKEYLGWLENNRAESTYERVERIFKAFISYMGDNALLSAVNQRRIEQYQQERRKTIKATTMNIEIRHLKAAFSKAVEWEYLKTNPFKYIKQQRVERPLPRYLTGEEISEIFKVMERNRQNKEEYKLLFGVYIYTGMRRSEALNLRWGDIDFKNMFIRVENTKTKIPRVIPLINELYEMLTVYKKTGKRGSGKIFHISPNEATHRFKEYFRAIGKNDLRLHDLRHTFASQLVMRGVDLPTVQALLGHTSITTTMIYAHLSTNHIRGEMERAFKSIDESQNATKKHLPRLKLAKE